MKILCLYLIVTAPVFALPPEEPVAESKAPRASDPDAARLQGFSKGAQLVKPVGNPNSCTSGGTTYSRDDAGYAACAKGQQAIQPALGGKNPNNASPGDVMKISPSTQNGFR